MKILAIAQNTFREAIRNKVIYSALFFACFLVATSALFGTISLGSQIRIIKDFGLFCLSFFGTVITIILGVSLLNKEIKHKTVYNVLSKPLERWQFVLGKYLGLTLTVNILIALMGICLVIFASFFENELDLLLFQGILFCMMEASIVAAVAIFFSSIVVTTTLTGIFTCATYIAGRSMVELQYYIGQGEGYNPVLAVLAKAIRILLPDFSLYNVGNHLVYGTPASLYQALSALCFAISYSSILLLLAMFVFNRRDLP